jgi:hypothetical protein
MSYRGWSMMMVQRTMSQRSRAGQLAQTAIMAQVIKQHSMLHTVSSLQVQSQQQRQRLAKPLNFHC